MKQTGIREDIVDVLASDEAKNVTPLLVHVYLRLIIAPTEWWEQEGVLLLKGETRGGTLIPAWSQLVNHVGVPPEIVRKAIRWMCEKGILTYEEHENGYEIRILFEGLMQS